MRAVIQRVSTASVIIENRETRSIKEGLVVLLGIGPEDTKKDCAWLAGKIVRMRLFDDDSARFNISVLDVSGEILLVSQFTLMAITKKGNRPSWDLACPSDLAYPIYEDFLHFLRSSLPEERIVCGEFGSSMRLTIDNEGPCTIILDSKLL